MADFEVSSCAFHRTDHPDARWFAQGRMGLFMHWGIHSVAGIQPSWAMIKDYPHAGTADYPPERYFGLANRFNPQHYEPEQWLSVACQAGFSYAVMTAKHHDGYTLWPSEHGCFGTAQHLGGTDLVDRYVQACRNTGMRVGLYFSFADWHYPGFPMSDVGFDYNRRGCYSAVPREEDDANFEAFYRFTMNQLDELLTRYGNIDLLWFDGVGWKGRDSHALRSEETIAHVRQLQPGIVVNNRWGKVGDYVTPECHFPEERPAGWWEACYCTNGHWGYNPGKALPSASWFADMRRKCNDWGGNFLPNIGPSPDGTMPEDFYMLCSALAANNEKGHTI